MTTPNGTSAANPPGDQFTYAAPAAPTVTGVSPSSGPTAGGTGVTITGTGFTGATAVDFGANAATSYTVVSDTEITATSPSGSGTVDVTVTTPNGTSATSGTDHFTYVAPGFQITTSSLPDAVPGQAYGPGGAGVTFQTSGAGAGAVLKWKKVAALPKGLKFKYGKLFGTPSIKHVLPGTNAQVSVQVTEIVPTLTEVKPGKYKYKKVKTTVYKTLTLHIA